MVFGKIYRVSGPAGFAGEIADAKAALFYHKAIPKMHTAGSVFVGYIVDIVCPA